MKGIVLAVGFLFVLFSGSAEAKRHKHKIVPKEPCWFFCESSLVGDPNEGRKKPLRVTSPRYHFGGSGIGPKPRRWCGWFMQHDTGVTSRSTGLNLNRAIEWRRVGRATSAGVGAIVVWAHHVGRIIGGTPGKWIVRSGNDGRAVRERVRSVAGAVAFRAL